MPRPLTRDAGPTPLDARSGGEWEQSVGSRYREGWRRLYGNSALVASQHTGLPWFIVFIECVDRLSPEVYKNTDSYIQ